MVDEKYPLLASNEVLVIVDYQPDGSSFNMYKQYWNNPQGFAFFRKTEMMATHGIIRKLIVCTHYVSSSIICRNRSFIQESPKKLLTFLCIPSGVVLYLWIRRNVRRNAKISNKKVYSR